MAGGCLLFNGCGADNTDSETINSEIEELNEAEPIKENETEAEKEPESSDKTETETEVEFAYGEISEKAEEILSADIPNEKAYIPAYVEVIRQQEAEYDIPNRLSYDLIYLDEDEIPELVLGVSGYWVSVYTYADGEVYTVIDGWGYGAMGNSGYDYLPQENVIRNYNTDLAGIILYTTYCRMDDSHEIEVFCSLKQSRLDDEGNYPKDSEAFENAEWHYFYEEQEVAMEEYDSHIIPGDYAAIIGSKTAMEMLEEMYEISCAE